MFGCVCVQSYVPAQPESSLLCMPSSFVVNYISTLYMQQECRNCVRMTALNLGVTWVGKNGKGFVSRVQKTRPTRTRPLMGDLNKIIENAEGKVIHGMPF